MRQSVYLKPGFDPLEIDKNMDVHNLVLCFDDLERANMDYGAILGYVNLYVEHKQIKTLFLCNEEPILKDSERKKSYISSKEKVIGKTIEFEQQPEQAIQEMIKSIGNEEYRTFLSNLIDQMIELFIIEEKGKSETINLRTLKHAIYEFERLYKHGAKMSEVLSQQGLLERMLLVVVLLTKEIKSNATIASIIMENESMTIDRLNASMRPIAEGKRNLVGELVKYTAHSLFQGEFPYFRSIGIFLLTGNFNDAEFLDDLKFFRREHETNLSNEQPAPEKLLMDQYWKLSDQEFNASIFIVLQNVEAGRYKLMEYLHIYDYIIHFKKNGLLNEKYEEGLLAKFKKGIDIAIKLVETTGDNNPLDLINSRFRSSELFSYIKEQWENKQNQEYEQLASEMSALLKINPKQFVMKLYEYRSKLDFPLFQYIEADAFVDDLFALDNGMLMEVRNAIINRYEASNIGDYLQGDRVPLNNILKNIEFMNENTPASSLSGYLRKELYKDLLKIVEKLTPKQL
ncbi:hypothetical protein [Paenibacillus luteus]|uniref:hypothetical protein n=1 Tax=Paenibacillus luteus TaxID=2545753 RepID=UPI0019D5AEAB|nr:hypothetical protein [Paenibacillus luteus]